MPGSCVFFPWLDMNLYKAAQLLSSMTTFVVTYKRYANSTSFVLSAETKRIIVLEGDIEVLWSRPMGVVVSIPP